MMKIDHFNFSAKFTFEYQKVSRRFFVCAAL